MPPTMFTADRRDNGQTLVAVLRSRLSLSWSKAKQTIERRHVRVGGQIVADGAYRVKTGKRITIAVGAIENAQRLAPTEAASKQTQTAKVKTQKQEKKPSKTLPPAMAVEIVYVDDAIIVANKPAGLTTMRHADEAAEFGKGKRFLPRHTRGQAADAHRRAEGEGDRRPPH